MFCPECGSANAENAKFCYQCGSALLFPHSSKAQQVTPSASAKNPNNQNKDDFGYEAARLILLVICGFIIVGGAVFAVNKFLETERNRTQYNPSMANAANASNMANAANIAPAPVKQLLFDENMQVAARSLKPLSFTINRSTKITGGFGASGGSNDIDCYIVDEENFIELANGNSFKSFYSKKNVAIGKIDLQLAPGTYYFVFDNRKAFMTDKIIKTKIFTEN